MRYAAASLSYYYSIASRASETRRDNVTERRYRLRCSRGLRSYPQSQTDGIASRIMKHRRCIQHSDYARVDTASKSADHIHEGARVYVG